jgi:regulator of protease activity HflC (stomatin/prohibitin superfamily)
MSNEKSFKALNGYLILVIVLFILAVTVYLVVIEQLWAISLIPVEIFFSVGFVTVSPNYACIMVLFGKYKGTIKENGFFWINPFYTKKKLSLRARNFNSEPLKVNDKIGNPLLIGAVLVWRISDTYKAAFDVNEVDHFVVVQTEAALRKLAGKYPYDNFEDEAATVTLRASSDEVNGELENEIRERLDIAGIQVIEARINQLAYAPEIAGAMLRRQQATAVVAARYKIVEGAVSMVQMALEQLSNKKIVDLDEEKKAAMVSNLMVVLCGDKDTSPVINTGTLHQ